MHKQKSGESFIGFYQLIQAPDGHSKKKLDALT